MEIAASAGRSIYVVASAALIGAAVLSLAGCATRAFVREQVGGTEVKLTDVSQRVDAQEAKLRETSSQVDQSQQRIEGLDAKVGQVGTLAVQANEKAGQAGERASEAKKTADEAAAAARDAESRLAGRIANRNQYSTVESQTLRFDSGKSELKDESINALREIARALKQDANAVVELRGHTDGTGSNELNLRLSRERVDAVIRYLVHKEGVELRRIYAVGLGKADPAADNGTREGRARNRRVDVVVLSTQS
jgi:outer membrane protein OmpA-like peptidoglycan-associated protein